MNRRFIKTKQSSNAFTQSNLRGNDFSAGKGTQDDKSTDVNRGKHALKRKPRPAELTKAQVNYLCVNRQRQEKQRRPSKL